MNIHATFQEPDQIIYRGDTMKLFSFPLYYYPNATAINTVKSFKFEEVIYTANVRGYVATWSIVDGQLYLVCIQNTDRSKQADLKTIFGDKYKNGKVLVDWFSGTLYCEKGRIVFDNYDDLSIPSFEKEFKVEFKNGKFISEIMYDNSKSRQVDYKFVFESGYLTAYSLREHADSLINWKIIPKIVGGDISVMVRFSANEDGVMDSITLLNSRGDVFDSEAIRIVKSLPAYVQIFRGKFIRNSWVAPIIFSESSRNKFTKGRL